jgi:hypothetical protein
MEPNYDDNKQILNLIVEKEELPKYIYKYTTIESAILILNSSKLKFSKPSDFNDPFDCNLTINTNNTAEEIDNHIELLRKKNNLTDEKIKLVKSKFHNSEELFKITNNSIKQVKEEFGITCFSKNEKNLIMWAHYCDKHKGICMKFDILADPDFFMIPFQVLYKNEYPNFNYIRNRDGLAKFLVETKSKDWEYEQEIRVMKHGPDFYDFKKEALVEIIFGIRTKDDDRKKIVDALADNSYCNIDFKSCLISDSKFEIMIKS